MKRNGNIVVLISCLITVCAVAGVMLVDKIGAVVSSLITTSITVFGAALIWIQLRRNRFKNSIELVYNMNTILLKSPGLVYFRDKLLKTSNPKDFSVDGKIGRKDTTKDIKNCLYDDSVNIIEYLEFFENIAEMYYEGSVTIKDLDNCFGDMFFAAMNNPYMQQREIVPYKEHYQKIIKMYGVWFAYREKRKIISPYAETPLNWKSLEARK